jgi:hypothetical protein
VAAPSVDPDRIAAILADAQALGDKTACDNWNISRKTLDRHRKRAAQHPELSKVVAHKKEVLERTWADDRGRVLRRILARIDMLVAEAPVEQLRDVVGAAKVLGDLELVARALNDEQQPSSSGASEAATGFGLGAAVHKLTH